MIRRGKRCGWPVSDEQKRARICGKPATCERTVDGIAFTMCDACAARYDAARAAKEKAGAARPERLDFTDATAVRAYFADLRVVIADLDALTGDALRPVSKRELGARTLREHYAETRKALRGLLDYADPQPPEPDDGDGEPGDPAGNGGAGPTH